MKSKTFLLTLGYLGISFSALGQGFGESTPIHEWEFRLEDESEKPDWQPVIVPHDWSVTYPASPDNASCTGYLPGGIGWYQTKITVPETNDSEKQHYLYFEGVYNRSSVYVNGTLVGERPNSYVSFLYDVSPYLKEGETNTIQVRVDHSLAADSRWYTGSGIYRPVHLVSAGPIHFGLWGIQYATEFLPDGSVQLSVTSEIVNKLAESVSDKQGLEIRHILFAPDGSEVGRTTAPLTPFEDSTQQETSTLKVVRPERWSVESPQLYRLESELWKNGDRIDHSTTIIGLRSIEFNADRGFSLNGKNMKLKGVCLHHDAGVLGAAVPKQVWRERLASLKAIGCNAIRMSHNPQATDLYDLCDELGFLVMDEAFDEWEYPKKKWLVGWNKGEPGFQGSADFFHQWGARDLEAMVKRDRNHPSIIMWSIGNEVDYPNDPYSHPILDEEGIGQQHVAGYQKDQPPAERLGSIAQTLAAVVRRHDTTRPVTAALAGAVMSNQTDYPYALDVVGYNYTEYRYDADHETYPERILYGSETRHDLAAWKSVAENDFIFGQFIWTGFDYLGEAGPWPSRGFTTGMIDLANTIKPRGHFRRALWSDEPVAYLGTYQPHDPKSKYISMDAGRNWNYNPGDPVRVVCYTNAESAELWLDGKRIGKRKPYDHETAIIYWDVKYQPGSLELVTYRDGKRSATDALRSGRLATSLGIETLTPRLTGKYDVAVLTLSVLDETGIALEQADVEISCDLTGPARLLGLENASNDASENFLDSVARTRNGKLIAYLQATESTGIIKARFTAPGFDPIAIEIPISDTLAAE